LSGQQSQPHQPRQPHNQTRPPQNRLNPTQHNSMQFNSNQVNSNQCNSTQYKRTQFNSTPMQHWWCAGRSRAPEFYLGVAPCAPMLVTQWWLTPPLTRLTSSWRRCRLAVPTQTSILASRCICTSSYRLWLPWFWGAPLQGARQFSNIFFFDHNHTELVVRGLPRAPELYLGVASRAPTPVTWWWHKASTPSSITTS